MEKIELKVVMDQIRYDALVYFMSTKENSSPQKELDRALTEMYEKYVPAETRGYLDSRLKPTPAPKVRPKRPVKPAVPTVRSEEDAENGQS